MLKIYNKHYIYHFKALLKRSVIRLSNLRTLLGSIYKEIHTMILLIKQNLQ
jgi:hypothetical protein